MKTLWLAVGTEEPCTGCGKCCLDEPCPLAGGHNPCIALQHHDGRYWCGLVELGVDGVEDYLLVGMGCGAEVVPVERVRLWPKEENSPPTKDIADDSL